VVDLVALASLFVDVFGASKEWTEPKIVRLDPPSAAEQEPSFNALKAKGHELQWVRQIGLRQLKRDGWSPVFERDAIARPTIFMDRLVRRTRTGPSSSAKGSVNALGLDRWHRLWASLLAGFEFIPALISESAPVATIKFGVHAGTSHTE